MRLFISELYFVILSNNDSEQKTPEFFFSSSLHLNWIRSGRFHSIVNVFYSWIHRGWIFVVEFEFTIPLFCQIRNYARRYNFRSDIPVVFLLNRERFNVMQQQQLVLQFCLAKCMHCKHKRISNLWRTLGFLLYANETEDWIGSSIEHSKHKRRNHKVLAFHEK